MRQERLPTNGCIEKEQPVIPLSGITGLLRFEVVGVVSSGITSPLAIVWSGYLRNGVTFFVRHR